MPTCAQRGFVSERTALDLSRLAHGLALAGRAVAAARTLASAEAVYEERDEGTLSAIRTGLDDDALAAAWQEGKALTPDDVVAQAFAERPDA